MFRAEFSKFSVSFDYFPAKKVRKPKNEGNQRELVWGELVKANHPIKADFDFEGSELREDQSSCAKKLCFLETNHICTELLQKIDSQRLFTDLKDFLYGVY
jgi:hypothetical protein